MADGDSVDESEVDEAGATVPEVELATFEGIWPEPVGIVADVELTP